MKATLALALIFALISGAGPRAQEPAGPAAESPSSGSCTAAT